MFAVETLREKQAEEHILNETSKSRTFRVKDSALFDLYERQLALFWQPREIDPTKDAQDWMTLTPDEKHFISMVLAFFASADSIVFDNIDMNFMNEVQITEAKFFYGMQAFMENIHSQVYMSLLTAYVQDVEEQQRLVDSISSVPSIRAKGEWAMKYFSREYPFAMRLIAFAVVEGIFFSGAFCAIFWLKKYRPGKLEALTLANLFISRDESLHTEFAVELFHRLERKPFQETVHALVNSAVELETTFTNDALQVALIGMDASKMKQYIQFCSDRLLTQLGYEQLYRVANPFDWMLLQSMRVTTNFFEGRVHEYSLASQGGFSDTAEF